MPQQRFKRMFKINLELKFVKERFKKMIKQKFNKKPCFNIIKRFNLLKIINLKIKKVNKLYQSKILMIQIKRKKNKRMY